MELEHLLIAVPGDEQAVERLVAELERIGLLGWAIDGARLAYPGWVLARVLADEDLDALVAESDDRLSTLEPDALAEMLSEAWPGVQVGEVEINGEHLYGPECVSSSAVLHEVAVSRAKGMGLDLEASLEKLRLGEVRVGDRIVFARPQPISGDEEGLLDVFTSAKGGSVVLWRREPHVMLTVLRRSKPVEMHMWEPRWVEFGVEPHRELCDALRPAAGDASEIAQVLGLAAESVVPLRALMRRESPPLDQLCGLLNLPPEALQVISGECAVEDIPGAVVHEPQSLAAAFRKAMKASEDDPAWAQWIDAGSRELRAWYVVSSAAFAALCGSAVFAWLDGGSTFWGLLGAVGLGGTVIDLGVRWVLKRRRAHLDVEAP